MSGSDNDNAIHINKKATGIDTLPIDDPNWSNANGIFLQENNITELNADLLPRGLLFFDISDNPLKKITGKFPPGLISLVLARTKIEKIGLIPDTLTEFVIKGTPLARKYFVYDDITDKDQIKRISDIPIEPGTIMVDDSPGERNVNANSDYGSNTNSVNLGDDMWGARKPAYNSDDTRHIVMIIERVEEENDILYRVQTLNSGEKLILKQNLLPYEPRNANLIQPLPLTNPPLVYTKEGHGEDILFEKPVPPGCVYVTIEQCGILSSNWGKLLFAFEDKPPGIREKLRDPIKYKKDLLAHFGRAFHVHYPEAEKRGDRTYVESIHYPFLAWYKDATGNCKLGKSGVLNLDDNNVFVDETIPAEEPYDEEQVLKVVDRENITDEDLHKLLDGSKFPTYQMIKDDLAYLEDGKLSYFTLKKTIDKYAFTQSWSFKMFPGIHYNFSCRDIAKHPPINDRFKRRRALSLEGPSNNINALTDEEMKGNLGSTLLSGYAKADIMPLVNKILERGVDVNKRDASGNTLLQWATSKYRWGLAEELLYYPGIDTTGAIESIEECITKLQSADQTDEEKALYRKQGDALIELVKKIEARGVNKGGYRRNKRRTKVRSRRIRRTRRAHRSK